MYHVLYLGFSYHHVLASLPYQRKSMFTCIKAYRHGTTIGRAIYLANQFCMAIYFLFGIYYFLFRICYIIFLFYCYFIVQHYVYVLRL